MVNFVSKRDNSIAGNLQFWNTLPVSMRSLLVSCFGHSHRFRAARPFTWLLMASRARTSTAKADTASSFLRQPQSYTPSFYRRILPGFQGRHTDLTFWWAESKLCWTCYRGWELLFWLHLKKQSSVLQKVCIKLYFYWAWLEYHFPTPFANCIGERWLPRYWFDLHF